MRVAIVQNRIRYGGRLSVLVEIVKLLNERNIFPDFLTFVTNITKEGIRKNYGLDIDFNIRSIRAPIFSKLPRDLNSIFFGLCLKKFAKNYDYFIDSNNTSFLMPSIIPILSYVHFPRKARLKSDYISIHDPEKTKKTWHSTLGIFLKLCGLLYNFDNKIHKKNLIVTNSNFSKRHFLNVYPNYKGRISVIYPPVRSKIMKQMPWPDRENALVSVGRFTPDKRQFEQIKIAEQIPGMKFYIIGFALDNNPYYQKCLEYIKKKAIKNVFIFTNLTDAEKRDIQSRVKYFLHTTINEPFGISTVEAIMSGCIPIVHDSGGQKEIVIFDTLRYRELNEVVSFLNRTHINEATLEKNNRELKIHCSKLFSVESFRQAFTKELRRFEEKMLST